MGGDRVASFGRRRNEDPEPAMLPPIQLPPVRLLLEVDRDTLLRIGDQIRDTVYNATTAGLQAAVEDFAAAQRGELDGGDPVDGDAEVMDTAGSPGPAVDPGVAGVQDSR